MKASAIVRETGLSRKRVDKWIRLEELPERQRMEPRPGMAGYFRQEALRLCAQGCQNAKELLIELRTLGYVGCYSGLTRLLREHRRIAEGTAVTSPVANAQAAIALERHISPQVAAALLSKPRVLLTSRQGETVDFLKERCPGFAAMRHLVLSFRGILLGGQVPSLQRWAQGANAIGIHAIKRFIRKMKQDWSAVENAVSQVWSNGPAEGHINRLKTLKRQMYGRARFDLLRARLLPLQLSPNNLHQT